MGPGHSHEAKGAETRPPAGRGKDAPPARRGLEQLQRAAGNRAVSRFVQRKAGGGVWGGVQDGLGTLLGELPKVPTGPSGLAERAQQAERYIDASREQNAAAANQWVDNHTDEGSALRTAGHGYNAFNKGAAGLGSGVISAGLGAVEGMAQTFNHPTETLLGTGDMVINGTGLGRSLKAIGGGMGDVASGKDVTSAAGDTLDALDTATGFAKYGSLGGDLVETAFGNQTLERTAKNFGANAREERKANGPDVTDRLLEPFVTDVRGGEYAKAGGRAFGTAAAVAAGDELMGAGEAGPRGVPEGAGFPEGGPPRPPGVPEGNGLPRVSPHASTGPVPVEPAGISPQASTGPVPVEPAGISPQAQSMPLPPAGGGELGATEVDPAIRPRMAEEWGKEWEAIERRNDKERIKLRAESEAQAKARQAEFESAPTVRDPVPLPPAEEHPLARTHEGDWDPRVADSQGFNPDKWRAAGKPANPLLDPSPPPDTIREALPDYAINEPNPVRRVEEELP